MGDLSYRVRGSYFESCNCEAICPCRKIGSTLGGRSTYGECYGVLFLDGLHQLPWIRKARHLIGVRDSRIEIDGTEVTIGTAVAVRASERFETDLPVACGIPGYDRKGYEMIADESRVADEPFAWPPRGNCAFATELYYA